MKKIIFFFIALSPCLFAQNYEEIYLKNGSAAVIDAIEKNILSKDYWLKKLEGKDVRYGYYDNEILLSVVDKTKKKLEVISYNGGITKKLFSSSVIVGKNGDKLLEGDLKTPVGVYQLTRRFTPNDRYLGPLDGQRTDELKTKGCVAMQNDTLMKFDDVVDHKKTLAFIYEDKRPEASAKDIAVIISGLLGWKKTWSESDIENYLKFYDKNFERYDGMSLEKFKSMKRAIFSKKEKKRISFSNFLITPYPNLKNDRLFRVSFYEDYVSDTHKFAGQKTLYVKLYNDDMKIFIEE